MQAWLCTALMVLCWLASPATCSEWRSRSRSRRANRAQVLRLGPVTVGCALLSADEADGLQSSADGSRLADRIANGRPQRRPAFPGRPASQSCPTGVTYFDGCNSCSCGTEKFCTLKACNNDTKVDIFDPCLGVTCGYHQRCQAICVDQLCKLRPICVSDDYPTCHNCPWLCVDERIGCNDNLSGRCKPTMTCYRSPDQ